MLYMSYKYGSSGNGEESFRNGVLANANRGGENVATGAMIGALLGAECDIKPPSIFCPFNENP